MDRTRLTLLCAVWMGVVAALIVRTERRDNDAGDPGASPALWPQGTTLVRAPEGHTLVMVAHPKCPCTAASLEELDRVLREATSPVRAYVLLVRPAGAGVDFERGASFERARTIEDAQPVVDVDGREAALFGGRTSGHVVAFDLVGRQRFAGGLTPARGRSGDGPGRRALLALLQGPSASPSTASSPVFGCPVVEEVSREVR